MANPPKVFRQVPASAQFAFLYGRYRLSSWQMPYFMTTMTLAEAAASLRLVTEFPGAESLKWRIDELYQRDLDWVRVQRQIVPYLRSTDRPQFFNSLTVALLPMRQQAIAEEFGPNGWTPPSLEQEDGMHVVRVGPITFGYYGEWTSVEQDAAAIGQVRWNTDEVFGVAIDGQHRLAAIKELARGLQFDSKLRETRVPVILVILAKELGYECPPGQEPLIPVLRRLFIDLNKHAKVVKRSRQILLDDADPHSLCVRGLVGRQLTESADELRENPPRLPLSLVDWHSEQAKFEEGPYITTILGLDWIMTQVLGCKHLEDYADLTQVKGQLRTIGDALLLDFWSEQSATRMRFQECVNSERPFHYTGAYIGEDDLGGELGQILRGFQRVWSPAILWILTELAPYANLIRLRSDNESLSAQFVNWYALYARKTAEKKREGRATEEYNQCIGRLVNDPERPVSEGTLLTRLKEVEGEKGESLAFKVVFQKALVLAFLEFAKLRDDFLGDGGNGEGEELDRPGDENGDEGDEASEGLKEGQVDAAGDEDEMDSGESDEEVAAQVEEGRTLKEKAKRFVDAVNRLIAAAPEVMNAQCGITTGKEEHRLWLGSILGSSGSIDFTQGAAKRAMELVFWVAALDVTRADRMNQTFEEFWDSLEEDEDQVERKLRRSLKRFVKEGGAGGRIVRAREDDYTAELAASEARIRMEWLWKALGIGG